MATGLDVKLLRMLVAIDRHGSLTRAAEALGITQSALSHHIKDSERRMAVEPQCFPAMRISAPPPFFLSPHMLRIQTCRLNSGSCNAALRTRLCLMDSGNQRLRTSGNSRSNTVLRHL